MAGAAPNPNVYSRGEEWASCAVHGLGILASVVAIPWLVMVALRGSDPWLLAGGLAFGLSALMMFTTSVLYHAARNPRARLVLRRFDHAAIYLLIAGTYTPFTLGVLKGAWGWSIAGVVWGLAVLGILFKTTSLGFRFHKTSVLLYVAMGWLVIVAIEPLMRALDGYELGWLVAGGLCYTGGVAFYVWKSRPYTHVVWHLFVLAGVACHFVAVLSVTAPG
ncbi:MAG TPA: hemolysin III family protein [Steroidobacteraceae bacterium]|jgi:hemolysin III|nr:hemolysin III family protein [Steroidobacteraceae bacterium]